MNECLLVPLARRRASTLIARSKSSMTLVNSLSISSTLCGFAIPLNVLSVIVRICQIQKCRLPTETPSFDIVARTLRNLLHHSEHSRNCLLQNFCLFVHKFICDLVRKNQNSLQPTQEVRRHLVVPILFLQELKRSCVTSASESQEGVQTSNVT